MKISKIDSRGLYIPIVKGPHPNGAGVQKIYRFPNGYGASVVQVELFGLFDSYTDDDDDWELAVLKFDSPDSDEYELDYDTPITDDVLGYLSMDDVENTLAEIEDL